MSEQPAATINCGYSDEGLPIGLQIVGRRFDDLGVLGVAMAFEAMRAGEARPWPEPPNQKLRGNAMFDYSKMFDLSGRRALVIGGASGIGQASALRPGRSRRAGHRRRPRRRARRGDGADEIKPRAAARPQAMKIDMRDKASIEAAAQSLGALDALVVTPSINVRKPLLDLTDDEFDRVVDLNLKGVFRVLRAFAPGDGGARQGLDRRLLERDARQVVEPGQGVYAATKAGTLQMIRALAAELGPSGVRLNAVAPGVVETPLTKQIIENEAWYRAYADKSMLKRWAKPAEMAGAVVFLCSDASSYVTGSYLLVDGGWTAADGRFTPPLPKRAG